ncbi:MAG: hypothetical protein O3B08_05795 [Proteobacteria bacterium]|nr:hypothetical protein [Pseudomonadota bacterium]
MKSAAIFIWIGLAGIAGFALFNISFKVEQLESELSQLNQQILKEQNAVHVLRAEWSYLNRPENIENLARRHLPDLRYPETSQVGGLDDLNVTPPPTLAGETPRGTPVSASAGRND